MLAQEREVVLDEGHEHERVLGARGRRRPRQRLEALNGVVGRGRGGAGASASSGSATRRAVGARARGAAARQLEAARANGAERQRGRDSTPHRLSEKDAHRWAVVRRSSYAWSEVFCRL